LVPVARAHAHTPPLFASADMHAVQVGECLTDGCKLQDPIFKGNKVPNPEMGYPGGALLDPAHHHRTLPSCKITGDAL